VVSYTDPPANLLSYTPLYLQQGEERQLIQLAEKQVRAKDLRVRLEGITDRTAAVACLGAELVVPRSQLPPLPPGEYYWVDLQGLQVHTQTGVSLGKVTEVFDTPANAVLVVQGERERLLPLVLGTVVLDVDLAQGLMRVDWDPDF
jgi:16S rRNA processing protein RimM